MARAGASNIPISPPRFKPETSELDAPLHVLGFQIDVLSATTVTGHLRLTDSCCQVSIIFSHLHSPPASLSLSRIDSILSVVGRLPRRKPFKMLHRGVSALIIRLREDSVVCNFRPDPFARRIAVSSPTRRVPSVIAASAACPGPMPALSSRPRVLTGDESSPLMRRSRPPYLQTASHRIFPARIHFHFHCRCPLRCSGRWPFLFRTAAASTAAATAASASPIAAAARSSTLSAIAANIGWNLSDYPPGAL
ncbi:hypothetical protein KSP40_PGU007151 [Platanthera guangdongensis]|uniref:Uncharacterized protein n=1 Tax=Platanthera guangdongensis TaxID=2320717 RepID=A0ABR2LYP5_9ASPA